MDSAGLVMKADALILLVDAGVFDVEVAPAVPNLRQNA